MEEVVQATLLPRCDVLTDRTSLAGIDAHEYDSLQAIPGGMRLIELLPGGFQDPLSCSIITTRLGRMRYEALSYVWGDSTNTAKIYTQSGSIDITANLAVALRHLRHETESRVLYADAICINQRDSSEKAQQVSHMADIYRSARSVVIWLGPDSEGTAGIAFDCIIEYALYAHDEWQKINDLSTPNFIPLEKWKSGYATRKAFQAISDIFHRPWWFRVWVLQEAALAREATVMCGQQMVPLEVLVCFADAARHNVSKLLYELNIIFVVNCYAQVWAPYSAGSTTWMSRLPFQPNYDQRVGGRSILPLADLLRMAMLRDTTHRRDRIFALLGHPSLWIRNDINNGILVQPDYEIDFTEICQKTAVAAAAENNDLSLLSLVQHGTKNKSGLQATWIPTLSMYSNVIDFFFFKAGIDSKLNNSCATVCDERLFCEGLLLGDVTCPVQAFPYSEDLSSDEAASQFVDTLDDIMDLRPEPGPATAYQSLSKIEFLACLLTCFTLSLDDLSEWREGLTREVRTLRTFIREMMRYDETKNFNCTVKGFSQDELDKFNNLIFTCSNRRIFRTASGLWGLGPGTMQDSDICCVIYGSRVPYILHSNVDNGFDFVGECYVPGLMFGEVHDASFTPKVDCRMFMIC